MYHSAMTYSSVTEAIKTIGCIVCDAEDEQAAADLEPGEKAPKRVYTTFDRDEMLSRIYSGEAHRQHEEDRQERRAALDSQPRMRRGNRKS